MNDDSNYLATSRTFTLRAQVLGLMMKGAGYAMLAVVIVWFAITVIYGIGKLLPDESRETQDPTPYSSLWTDVGSTNA